MGIMLLVVAPASEGGSQNFLRNNVDPFCLNLDASPRVDLQLSRGSAKGLC